TVMVWSVAASTAKPADGCPPLPELLPSPKPIRVSEAMPESLPPPLELSSDPPSLPGGWKVELPPPPPPQAATTMANESGSASRTDEERTRDAMLSICQRDRRSINAHDEILHHCCNWVRGCRSRRARAR